MDEKPAFIRIKEAHQYGKTYLIRLDSIVKIEFGEQATVLHLIPHGESHSISGMVESGTPQSVVVSKDDGEAICKLLKILNQQGDS